MQMRVLGRTGMQLSMLGCHVSSGPPGACVEEIVTDARPLQPTLPITPSSAAAADLRASKDGQQAPSTGHPSRRAEDGAHLGVCLEMQAMEWALYRRSSR